MSSPELTGAFIGGAAAGFTEHLVMFPVDTIKTRLQVVGYPGMPLYLNIRHAITTIHNEEGLLRLYRGIPAVLLTAIPSHAAYFSVLEMSQHFLGANAPGNHPLSNAASGVAATMAHDLIVTPLDVVKQRLQVHNSKYTGTLSCLKAIVKTEGLQALYASYIPTLVMNVPFMAMFVSSYETCKYHLQHSLGIEKGPQQYLLAASFAGALSGSLTSPLDVIKTRIQVYGLNGSNFVGVSKKAASEIYKSSGMSGFFRGAGARAIYFTPSAAIMWTTYELIKNVFGIEIADADEEFIHM